MASTGSCARPRRAARSRSGNLHDLEHRSPGDRLLGKFIILGIADLRGLIVRFQRVYRVGLGEAPFDLRLLRVHGRIDRRQAGVAVEHGMLKDRLAEGVMFLVTGRFRRLRRLEAHVVPAEILEIAADLAEALGPHRRFGGTLAGEQAGGEGCERLGFRLHLRDPLTDRLPGGRNRRPDVDWPGRCPESRWARQRRCGGNSSRDGPICNPRARRPRRRNGPADPLP